MRRIGNFLFVQQQFIDAEPNDAIIAIDDIAVVMEQCENNKAFTKIILKSDNCIRITGEHVDNIIELSKLLNI
ncbi:MAG: hypothetical protein IJ341_09580 [Bacteroidales bacterium]|nr:hypothetical protein [Bacteroidales bacterium]